MTESNRAIHRGVASVVVVLLMSAIGRAQSVSDAQLQAEVERRIHDLVPMASRISVTARARVVALDGSVPNLWTKRQIIERTRKTPGVDEVDSTLEVVQAEDDKRLAEEVGKRLRSYARYSVYDFVQGRVRNGAVTLTGAVTNSLKQEELGELMEKTTGVRELENQVKVLPLSRSDDQLRASIASRIYADPLFLDYSRANPPIHIVVEHGHVTLFGLVSSQIERQKAVAVARGVPGVFSVDDQVQLAVR